jgi:hypothetical protein
MKVKLDWEQKFLLNKRGFLNLLLYGIATVVCTGTTTVQTVLPCHINLPGTFLFQTRNFLVCTCTTFPPARGAASGLTERRVLEVLVPLILFLQMHAKFYEKISISSYR